MNMDVKSMERDNTFDNIRALLIFLVVVGHMLSGNTGNNIVAQSLYYFIYFFHMPAFIFITGYFSKNIEKSRDSAFKTFLIPYLVFNILYTLLGKIDLFNQYSSFRLFSPVYGMWFLLAVFLWKILLKDLVRIRFIVPITLLVGILSGFSEEFGSYLTLARAINFLPFFLLGYYTTKDHVRQMKEFPKWMAYTILGLFAIIAYLISKYNLFNAETLYMRKAFSYAKQAEHVSVVGRIFLYMAGVLITICLINIFENKKRWYTSMGRNSLTVYVLHLFVVVNLKEHYLPFEDSKWYVVFAVIMAFIIAYILSREIFMKIYKNAMNIILNIILKAKKNQKSSLLYYKDGMK